MTWKVHLIKGPVQTFHDVQQALGQYYELKQGWISKIQSLIKKDPKYSLHLNVIESVQGPKATSLLTPFLILLKTKTQLTVTFLGELTENDSAYLIGLWPETFLKLLESDPEALQNLLYVTIEKPQIIDEFHMFL